MRLKPLPIGFRASTFSSSGQVKSQINRAGDLTRYAGLGRDAVTLECVKSIVQAAKEMNLPMVLDADALFLLGRSPDLLADYTNVILTPNIVEVRVICNAIKLIWQYMRFY